MSDEPEQRPGPPWIMDEMIGEEGELPAKVAESGSVARLRERLDGAENADEPIVFCGCGTSEHAARATQAIIATARPGTAVSARDSFEATLDPPARGLLVAISHSAETAATVDAALAALDRGARPVMITAAPDLVPEGIEAVTTPVYDRSWCHTVAYTSPMLTAALGAGMDEATARSVIAHELGSRHERARDAATVAGCDRLLIVGSGVDEVTGAELALKIEEAAHVPCTPMGVEKVLHGHLPAATGRTGLILMRYDGSRAASRDRRTADVSAACAVLDMPQVTLRSGTATPAEALLAGAVALQLLTLELATALGTNPDLIRREEPLYRKVAEVARAG